MRLLSERRREPVALRTEAVCRLREQLARIQLVDLVAIDKQLAAINIGIRDAVRATGTTLTEGLRDTRPGR